MAKPHLNSKLNNCVGFPINFPDLSAHHHHFLTIVSATSAAAARDKADSFNICLSEYSVKENRAIRGELVDYCECLKAVEDKKQQTIETITVSLIVLIFYFMPFNVVVF